MSQRMLHAWTILLLLVPAIALAEEFDVSKLYGDWKYVSGMKMGTEVDKERLVGTVKITKEAFHIPGGPEGDFVMSYKINVSKDPAEIDLKIEEGPVPEGSTQGIIKLSDGKITLCYDPAGNTRPKAFSSTEENGAYLFVLQRKE